MSLEPRIYVASLADYNAGRLHGVWIDATDDPDDISDQVREMLKASPEPLAEEWAIHDYEGFGGVRLSEFEQFERVSGLANVLAEHGEAYVAFVEHVGAEYADADEFESQFCGEWGSFREFADEYLAECEPETMAAVESSHWLSIDYDQMERYGDWFTADAGGGNIYVFDTAQ